MKCTLFLIVCFACSVALQANAEVTYPAVLKIGAMAFWGNGTPMEKYGDGNMLMNWPVTLVCQARMWKVGEGILVVEHTVGLLRIIKMTYVIRDDKGNVVTSFPVNEFNHVTGEMTITVPNQSLKQTGRANTTIKHG